jgi:hypothetical protein
MLITANPAQQPQTASQQTLCVTLWAMVGSVFTFAHQMDSARQDSVVAVQGSTPNAYPTRAFVKRLVPLMQIVATTTNAKTDSALLNVRQIKIVAQAKHAAADVVSPKEPVRPISIVHLFMSAKAVRVSKTAPPSLAPMTMTAPTDTTVSMATAPQQEAVQTAPPRPVNAPTATQAPKHAQVVHGEHARTVVALQQPVHPTQHKLVNARMAKLAPKLVRLMEKHGEHAQAVAVVETKCAHQAAHKHVSAQMEKMVPKPVRLMA